MQFTRFLALAVFLTHATASVIPKLLHIPSHFAFTTKETDKVLCSLPLVLIRDPILTPLAQDGAQDEGAVIVSRGPLLTPVGKEGAQDDHGSFKARGAIVEAV
jgi:hypothetical protein